MGPVDRVELGFDVIGDVHGCHRQLIELLHTLGYRDDSGVFRHLHGRRAIFVGDLIDRGPEQIAVINTVRRMHEAGTAIVIMGNHEFNAVCYATRGPYGRYLRRRNKKNRSQHKAFRRQTRSQWQLRRETIEWFKTLPLWHEESNELRIVHACWDPDAISGLTSQYLDDDAFIAASTKGSPTYRWVENLCKGPEVKLPDGYAFTDKDGHLRETARYRWWLNGNPTYERMCEIPPGNPLPPDAISDPPVQPYSHTTPVIFGHYWRKWPEADLSGTTVCVDHSAVKGGPLVAYRWSGEAILDQHNLVGVVADS